MRFTRAREQEVIDTLRENPEAHIVFPERAYRPDGRIIIVRDGRHRFLSRYLFELLVQPDLERIPMKLFLLRQCDKDGCHNPFHYAAFRSPKGEVAIASNTVANAVKTHCVHHHAFTPENTRVDKRGKRACRACDRIRKASR